MNILYITAGFFEKNAVSVRSRFNVAEFCKNGLKTDVLTLKPKSSYPNPNSIDGNEYFIHTVNRSTGESQGKFFHRLFLELLTGIKLSYKLYKLKRFYDFYYLTTPPFFSALVCKLTFNLLGMRHAIEVRDRYPQVMFDLNALKKGGVVSNLLLLAERYLYKNTEFIFCVTESQKIKIRDELGVKTVLARNGYDANLFISHTTPTQFITNKGVCLKVVTHGLFGKLFDEKTFLSLVNCCSSRGLNIKFLLAGHGPKLNYLLNANVRNIEYLGNLDTNQISDLLAGSHIGLSIHLDAAKDTFPVKVYEFIGAGLPSIVFPRSEAGLEIDSNTMGWSFNASDVDECCDLFENFFKFNELIASRVEGVLKNRHIYSRQSQASKIINNIKNLPRNL